MTFFFVINIVLINVFFGLIIDAFADMRALRAEKSEESDRRCFICGITKQTFDRNNISWASHIYQEHNLHAYLAYLIYTRNKPLQECNGVEKRVKSLADASNIDFFPMNDCVKLQSMRDEGLSPSL